MKVEPKIKVTPHNGTPMGFTTLKSACKEFNLPYNKVMLRFKGLKEMWFEKYKIERRS